MTEVLRYGRTRGALVDGLAAAERVLTRLRHDPSGIAVTLAGPIVLVVAFGYIIGSAIEVPAGGYREYLVPGLFVLIAVNIVPPLVTMVRDNRLGVVDRYRSMPIARSAVPLGQAFATTVYGLVNFVLMGLLGLLVGWRIERGAGRALAALGLLLLVQFAMTWVGLYLGLVARSQEAAGQLSLVVLPTSMVSNVMVPTRWDARVAPGGCGVEPGERTRTGRAGAVREPGSRRVGGVAAPAPGRGQPALRGGTPRRLRPRDHPPLRPPPVIPRDYNVPIMTQWPWAYRNAPGSGPVLPF